MFSINSIYYNLTKMKYLHIVPLPTLKSFKYALNKAKTNSSKNAQRIEKNDFLKKLLITTSPPFST